MRPRQALALAVVSLVAATACQDYNFNPIGHCLIQPGSKRVTLSDLSTADVLFVVDESGSMNEEQQALADNFQVFINNLDAENASRASRGLQPIDFHIAVTTSSVFENQQTWVDGGPASTCRSDCTGASGQGVCCDDELGTPLLQPRSCTPGGACPSGTSCRLDCDDSPIGAGRAGEFTCCAADGSYPAGSMELMTCSLLGVPCGQLERHYPASCATPIAPRYPFPRGDFVSRAGTSNPRVLHFDKELYPSPPNPAATNKQGFTRSELITWFQENIRVGICGTGMEQLLQGGRLAVQKALAGQQKDTRDASGNFVWTPPTATQLPGFAPALWPNPNSKLVVVFVGDEDDCASPEDPSGGVVGDLVNACPADATTPPPFGGKQFPVSELVDYFTGLGRPFAAGFIFPATQDQCTLDGSGGFPACTSSGTCSTALARGIRLLAAAQQLAARGVDVVAGSICDTSFADILEDIAEIVKPPSGLTLPTMPAEDDVTSLRITDGDGETRRLCGRPAPGGMTAAAAAAAGFEWWFTETGSSTAIEPVAVSRFVYINPSGQCLANPGETYAAEYLGRVPEGGCRSDADCQGALGGEAGSWTCFSGADPATQACLNPATAPSPGTCICGAPSKNCPNGYTG